MSQIEVQRGRQFAEVGGERLYLDIFRPRLPGRLRPALLQIHGGAWVLGFKEYQGIPLLTHVASNGWVGFNVDYRLSPRATFPEHLIDVKRALARIREHAEELGVDPDFIIVTGGSAGAHLAALVGLTAGDPEYQAGFESADTRVQRGVGEAGAVQRDARVEHAFDVFPSVRAVQVIEATERFLEATYRAHVAGRRESVDAAPAMQAITSGPPPTLAGAAGA